MVEEHTPSPRSRVPDLLVEKLLLGELSPDKAARVRAELEAEPHGLERVEELRRSNSDILFQYPPRSVVHAIEARAGVKRTRRSKLFVMVPTLAASAAAFVFYVNTTHVTRSGNIEPLEHTTPKGPFELFVYRQELSATPQLTPDSVVHPHDKLQLTYVAGLRHFGVIFSIDGRGGVTLHYPEAPGMPETLATKNGSNQQGVSLPESYQLDDAPAFERFFFVAGDAHIDINAVLDQARRLAADPVRARTASLNLPNGIEQTSITLRKETR